MIFSLSETHPFSTAHTVQCLCLNFLCSLPNTIWSFEPDNDPVVCESVPRGLNNAVVCRLKSVPRGFDSAVVRSFRSVHVASTTCCAVKSVDVASTTSVSVSVRVNRVVA